MLVFTHIFLAGHRRQRKMPRKSSGKPGRRCCLRRVVPTRPTIARGKSAAFWTFFAGTTVSSQKDMGHVQHRMGEGEEALVAFVAEGWFWFGAQTARFA